MLYDKHEVMLPSALVKIYGMSSYYKCQGKADILALGNNYRQIYQIS